MLLEYHRETASNASSDFYCFLYNRSRIKSLSKYFVAKQSESPLANSCKKNETVTPNKNVDNQRYLGSQNIEKETTKEGKILDWESWIESCDENSSDNATQNTEGSRNDKTTMPNEETNDRKNTQYSDTENNHFMNNYVIGEENKTQTNKLVDKSDNNVNLLTLVDSVALSTTTAPDHDVTKKTNSELSLESTDSNDSKSVAPLKKQQYPESCKENSLLKKSGQRKISDFFQRIS